MEIPRFSIIFPSFSIIFPWFSIIFPPPSQLWVSSAGSRLAVLDKYAHVVWQRQSWLGFRRVTGSWWRTFFFGMVYASGSSVAPEHPQNKFVKGQDIQEPRADQCRCLKANNHHGFLYNFLLNQTAVGHGGSPYLKKPLKKRCNMLQNPILKSMNWFKLVLHRFGVTVSSASHMFGFLPPQYTQCWCINSTIALSQCWCL